MPAIYQHIERSFTTEEVLGILHNPDWSRVIREPPVKPRGGQVFLYHYTEESTKDDWRCDQYHFKHDGLRKQPRTNPKFYKNFFILRTNHSNAKGDKRFKKHAYILIGDHKNLVLFQYLGDESVAQDLPHGNSKNASLLYTRLCPSVIEAIKDITVPSREVLQTLEEQARSSAVPEVHKPRSLLQISNTRSRVKRRSRTGKKKTRRKKKKKKEDPGTKHDTVLSPCLASTYLPERISAEPSAEADVTLSPDAMSPQTRLAALAQLCENICQENMVKTSNEEAQNLDSLVIDKVEAIDTEPFAQTGDDESGINNMSNPNTDIELEVTDTSSVFEVGRTECIPLANEDRDSNRLAETHKVCDIIQDSGISSSNMLVCDVQNSIDSDTNHTGHGGLGTRYTTVCSLPSTVGAPNTLEHHIEVMDSNQLHRILALVRETLQMVSPGTETCLSSNTKVTSTAFVNVDVCESNGDVSTLQQGVPCAVLQQGTSLPHTAVSLIAQVSSTWATDFQSIRQSLPRLNSLGSVIQTHLELLDLIAAVIVGAYRTSTDCLSFVETLKNYPSHLERNLSRQLPTDVDKGTKYRIGNYTISGTDILRLDGSSWLDDSVIHAFLHLLKKQYTEERQRDVKILECFQYKLWEKGNYSEWLYEKDQFSTFDWILMPICVNNHWVLLAANVSNRTVCIINCQTSRNLSPQVTQHWMKFMQCRSRTTGEELSVWRPLQQPVFQQTDGSSCGVFVLMAAEALVAGIPPAIMRTCHVAMYRHYVKQRIVSAAEVVQTATMEDVAIEGMDGAKPIDMVDISSERHINHSQGCEQEDLTVPTDEALQITTEAMNSTEVMTDAALPCDHRPGNAQADLDEGQSEDEESGKSGSGNIDLSADKKHADDCKETITEEEEMMDASTEHVSDEECDEHATLGKPNTSVLLDCTPLPALAQCEAIYQNERLHFTALTLLCMEKGRLHLSDLTEVSESLQSHITWSCQLSGVEELSPVQVKTCLHALNTTLLTIDDDVVQFRQEKALSHIKDILTNNSVEYMAKVDLEFIYLHVKLHHTDASMDEEHVFTLSLDRARQKDLAQRFAQEIMKHNFAFTLSHQAAGKHTFCVQVARLIKQYMQTGSMTELFASSDIKHNGNFLNWLCFGRNAELYKVLWMYIPEVAKEECLIYCCVSGNLDVLQLLLEDMDLKDVLSLKPKMQVVQGIHSCGIKTQALATHFLPPLHLSSYYGHTDIVTCLLQLGCDINAQLPDEFDGREGPAPPGSTPAATAASGGHTAVLQCLIDHHAATNLVDCNNNSLLHLACKGGHTDAVMLLISECDTSARNIDGNTPLHLACEERKLRVVEVLLKTNVDVTLLNYQAFTPFDIICQKGYLDIAILVLNATSYPLPHDGNNTPLHAACRGGYTELVKTLLRYDANRSVCNNTSRMNRRFEKSRPLMFSMRGNDVKHSPFFEACENGHIDIVRLLIEKGADVSAVDGDDYTPLHWACKNGHIDIVRLLIEKGADVSAVDGDVNTPLDWACKNGHIDIVRLLIEKGADVSAVDGDVYTPLDWACKNGHIDIVRLLIEKGADVSARDTSLHYALLQKAVAKGDAHCVYFLTRGHALRSFSENQLLNMMVGAVQNKHFTVFQMLHDVPHVHDSSDQLVFHACEHGQVQVCNVLLSCGSCHSGRCLIAAFKVGNVVLVELLLKCDVDVNAYDGEGNSSLHLACELGDDNIVKLLIEKGQNLHGTNAQMETPLFAASRHGHVAVVKLVLSHGADITKMDIEGNSVLHYACLSGKVDLLQLFIQHISLKTKHVLGQGEPVSLSRVLYFSNKNGESLLHVACRKNHNQAVEILLQNKMSMYARDNKGNTPVSMTEKQKSLFVVLCNFSCELQEKDSTGNTLLHIACDRGYIECVDVLCRRGANVSASNNKLEYAVHKAAESGRVEIMDILLAHEADINVTDIEKQTPLHLACAENNLEIVEILIRNKADVNVCDKHHVTPLHLACRDGFTDIAAVLLKAFADDGVVSKNNVTPLVCACEGGHIKCVKLLLRAGANVNVTGHRGNTPLHRASAQGHESVVKVLLSCGADPLQGNINGKLPLHHAVLWGHLGIVKVLIDKCKSYLKESSNMLLLLESVCSRGYVEILKCLMEFFDQFLMPPKNMFHLIKTSIISNHSELLTILEGKGCNIQQRDDRGWSILQVVCESEGIDQTSLDKVLELGFDLREITEHGESLLHIACKMDNIETVKHLIEKGANVHSKDNSGDTVLHVACAHGYFDTATVLIKKGLSINEKNLKGLTSLDIAIANKHYGVTCLYDPYYALSNSRPRISMMSLHHICRDKKIQLLYNSEIVFSEVDSDGNSALHISCLEDSDEIVQLLVIAGARLKLRNTLGEAPVHVACRGTLSCLKAMTDAVVNRDLLKTVVTSRDRNNNTPLHTVAHERKFEHLCLLLEKGADVNLANNFDQTALHIACYVGDANIVLTLLNARANILAKDKCGNTPLHIICTEGNLSLLRLINHNEAVIATRNYEGRTPLHEAVNRGYHAMILYMMTEYWHFTQSDLSEEGLQYFIIRMGREDFTKMLMGETICPDSEGNTPLHHAAETKSLVTVKTLMRRGYSCQATNELGETPLFNACLKGSATIVELFLKEGSPPCITNDNNITPLHVACQTGHVDIVVLLFDYDPDLGARTHLGQTVLHLACMSGSADVVEALLKARSDINARDNNLDTPLHMAAMHGKIDSIILLAKWGARDVQCNQQGDLALHHACREGRSDAVKTLLNIDSDASVLNHQGVSPVMLACDRDCVSMLELLLQRLLVEVQIESVQPTDDSVHEKYVTNLNYCLYCACKHNYLGILKLLIKYNVDINHTFTDTELKLINRQSIEELSQSENEHRTLHPTALHIACYRGHATCVETLMRSGALSESKTSSGDTPLHVACIHGHDDTVALLLKGGVSASPVSDNGTTPLHYACRGGFEDVVSRLLAAGADPDAEDGDGKTPLAVSRGRGVADMFLKR